MSYAFCSWCTMSDKLTDLCDVLATLAIRQESPLHLFPDVLQAQLQGFGQAYVCREQPWVHAPQPLYAPDGPDGPRSVNICTCLRT